MKNKIKQYALLSGNGEAEVYSMLLPLISAIIAFIITALVLQSLFIPFAIVICGAVSYFTILALIAVVQSADTFLNIVSIPSLDESN